MNNFLTEEEELEIVLAISSKDAHDKKERDRQIRRDLVADEAFARALELSSEEAHEQKNRDRQIREQKERDLVADEAFARALALSSEEVHEHRVRNPPRSNGLLPQEAAAFAAYERCDKYNNYGKKKYSSK
jgi:hypothetical protein